MAEARKSLGGNGGADRHQNDSSRTVALSSQRLAKFPDALLKKKAMLDTVELDLSSNILSALPPKLVKLSHLRILRLSRNRFTDFPPVICELFSLRELHLEENQITTIPSTIQNLKALSLLNVTHNRLAELPKELGLLPSLRRIELAGNPLPSYHEKLFSAYARQPQALNLHGMELDRVPDGIGLLNLCLANLNLSANGISTLSTELFELRFLKELDLRKNKLKEIPPIISRLNALRVLILSSNELTSLPPAMAELKKLRHLAISGNRFYEFPPVLCDLPELSELFLGANEPGLETIPEGLTRVQSLSLLYLKDNRIRDWACNLSQLPCLRKLSLSGNPISDLSVERFVACESLEDLDLTNTRLPIVQQKMIEGAVKKSPILDLSELPADLLTDELVHFQDIITHLCFSNNQLQTVPSVMVELPKLLLLDLSFNELRSLPEAIATGLPQLENLILHHNYFEEVPAVLAGMAELRKLDLTSNRVSSFDLDEGALPALKDLLLGHNSLTELSPSLLRLTSLGVLDVSSNNIDALPEKLSDLSALEELYLDNNSIEELPACIASIAGLHSLRVTNNKLKSVPEELLDMNIILLSLGGNQLDPVLDELLALYTTRAGTLDLRGKAVSAIPAPVFKLAFIQELCLAENELVEIPPAISEIRLLSRLDISCNRLAALPDEIGNLEKLRTLVAHENRFTSIPWQTLRNPRLSIADFSANEIASIELDSSEEVKCPLEVLSLDGNDLESLPSALYAITTLKNICVEGNPRLSPIHRVFCSPENRIHPMELVLAHQDLDSLPEEVFSMQHLTGIDLSGNKFTAFPVELASLPNLTKLDISTTTIGSIASASCLEHLVELRATNCNLTSIPPELYGLTALQRLLISFNDIETLPEDLSRLTALKELHVANNQLVGLPEQMPVLDVLNVRRNPFNSGSPIRPCWGHSNEDRTGTPQTKDRRSTTSTLLSKSSPNIGKLDMISHDIGAGKAESAPVSPARSMLPLPASDPIPVVAASTIVLPEDIDDLQPIPKRPSQEARSESPTEKGGKTKINRKLSTGWKKLSKRARTWTEIGGARSPPDNAKRSTATNSLSPRGGFASIPRRPSGFRVLVTMAGADSTLTPVVVDKKLYSTLTEAITQELGLSEPIKRLEVMASPNWIIENDKGVRNLEPNDVITVHV